MNMPMPVNLNKKELNESYRLSDFIGKDDEYINNSMYEHLLIDYTTLIDNIDLLKHILKLKNKKIICVDYESMIILDKILDKNIPIILLDDYTNKDRSYLDLQYFEKRNVIIPLSYVMWNMKLANDTNIYCFRYNNGNMFSSNGDTTISKETILKISDIVQKLDFGHDDIDNVLLVSNYLQERVQYIEDGGITVTSSGKFIVDAPKDAITREKVGSLKTVIDDNYGLCMAIANATTLLLNNPTMNVNVRSMFGSGHVWNLARIDNKQYYIDNTFGITRNKDKISFALKALSFDDKYVLFGKDELTPNHFSTCHIDGDIESSSYDRTIINSKIKTLSNNVPFTYVPRLSYPSMKEN